jgi:hypothetical protein
MFILLFADQLLPSFELLNTKSLWPKDTAQPKRGKIWSILLINTLILTNIIEEILTNTYLNNNKHNKGHLLIVHEFESNLCKVEYIICEVFLRWHHSVLNGKLVLNKILLKIFLIYFLYLKIYFQVRFWETRPGQGCQKSSRTKRKIKRLERQGNNNWV